MTASSCVLPVSDTIVATIRSRVVDDPLLGAPQDARTALEPERRPAGLGGAGARGERGDRRPGA